VQAKWWKWFCFDTPTIIFSQLQKRVKYDEEIDMNTVSVDLSFEQITKALQRLPAQEKIALWRLLDKELDRPAIARKFASSVNAIRKTYASVSEEEVMADAVKAARQVRKARYEKNRS
jgi:hypothetical protein